MAKKGKRGPAKCKKKFLNPDDFKVEFDARGLAKGKNRSSFMSWVGLECRKKIPYHKVAKDVDEKLYDNIWEYTKVSWNIPDDRAKEVTLKKAKVAMKNFRHTLRSKYVEKDKTPFKVYDFLDKQHWETFVAISSTEEFKEKSQKASTSARKNVDPARVGRCGFVGLEDTWEIKWNQLVSSYPHLIKIQDERSKIYVVSRAHLDPVTHLLKLDTQLQSEGELTGTLEALLSKEKEMMEDGSYYEPGKDVVTEVIGNGKQHGGRTRLYSDVIGVTDSLFSDLKRKKKKCSAVESTAAKNSNNHGSSNASGSLNNQLPEMKSVQKCELLWPYDKSAPNMVLATGVVYLVERVIHHLPIKDGFVKVHVDMVEETCKKFPVLHEIFIEGEIQCMGDTIGQFIQWPKKSLKILNTDSGHSVSVPEYRSPESVKLTQHSISGHYMPEFEENLDYQAQMMPSQDETHDYQKYTKALQDERAFEELLNGNFTYQTEPYVPHAPTMPVHVPTAPTMPVHAPIKTVPKSVPPKPIGNMAELLEHAKSSRPQSIYKLAQQLALKFKMADDIDFSTPSGMYEVSFQETIELEAAVQLCVNGWANVSIVNWFTMYLYVLGRKASLNETAYFNPRFIESSLVETEKNSVIQHIRSVISFQKNKKWFMAPHLIGSHWILVLLQWNPIHKRWTGHIFDSLGKKGDPTCYRIRAIFEEAIQKKITWKLINCPQQANTWQSGYCVMMAMYEFVITNREHILIPKRNLVCQEEIDKFVERTLKALSSIIRDAQDQDDEYE